MASKDAGLVEEVIECFDVAWSADRSNRLEASSDLRFLAGDQWPQAVRLQREAGPTPRPMLTINLLPAMVQQVTNEIRQADLGIKVSPVDGKGDKEIAKIYNGLLRQIQANSSASHVFASAAESQVACGIGWVRIRSDYTGEDSFDQELILELIRNPMSVYCDPAATEADRSDAMWIGVTELVPKSTFKLRYPGAAIDDVSVPNDNTTSAFLWNMGDDVRIAEYWKRTEVMVDLALMQSGEVIKLDGLPPQMLATIQPMIQGQRKAKSYKVDQYIVSGSEKLSGPHPWPGMHIPLVPLIGKEVPLEHGMYRHGMVRFARDAQQLYNFYRTAAAETIALAPKAPYLVTPSMIGAQKAQWDTANTSPRPYLVYEPDPKAPGARPIREHPPEMPAAMMQEAQIAHEDLKSVTGIHDASMGMRSNETSGKAITARKQQGEVANYHYMDNLNRSLEHVGRILVDMIPKIYDNQRVIKIIGEDETESTAQINHVVPGPNGQQVKMNDLSVAKFDIRVTIGPSYATKRMEAADSLIQFMQAVPNSAAVIGDLVAMNMDWPGADEIAKRLKNMVPPNLLVDPEKPETKLPPPPNPLDDPMVAAEHNLKVAQTKKTLADAELVALQVLAGGGPAMAPDPRAGGGQPSGMDGASAQPGAPMPPPDMGQPPQQGMGPMPPQFGTQF